jgi:ketosteroid isomerase-like protein
MHRNTNDKSSRETEFEGDTMKNAILLCAAIALCVAGPGHALASAADEAQIHKLLDNWAKAFHDKNLGAIMSMYAPGNELVAYDVVPPLRYVGYDAYKKDYRAFLAQYKGPIDVEYRDLAVVAGDTVAFSHGLERMSGTLANGQKSEMWLRFTSCFQKINGRWLDTHDHVSVPADLDKGTALTNLVP